MMALPLVLAACGGGGGSSAGAAAVGSTGGTSGSGSGSTVAAATALVTVAPTSTYIAVTATATATASDPVIVYNDINTLRAAIGSGYTTQNTALDQAALAHWKYLTSDATALLKTHDEVVGQTGYTGATPTARAVSAGYNGTVTEVIYAHNALDDWSGCTASWANSVYHVQVLYTGGRDIGIASYNTKGYPSYGQYTLCIVETGVASTASEQLPAAGTIRNYPYANQTGLPIVFYNQTETPVPLPDYSELGTPITLNFKTVAMAAATSPTVVINTLTVTPAGGTALPAAILANGMTSGGPTLTTDSNLDAFTVALVPLARMTANTVYTVVFSGTVQGVAASKTWTFTTGS